MIARIFCVLALWMCFVPAVAAQETPTEKEDPPPSPPPTAPPPPPPDYKWFAGGAVGLSFGNQVNYIEFSPIIGYQVAPKFQLGGSLTYRYRKDKRFEPDLSTTDLGASVLGRYFFFGPIFVQAEVERLRWEYIDQFGEDIFDTVKETYTGLYGGIGFVQQSGGRGALYMAFLWDFNYKNDEPNPRNDPFRIQIGYGVRF